MCNSQVAEEKLNSETFDVGLFEGLPENNGTVLKKNSRVRITATCV